MADRGWYRPHHLPHRDEAGLVQAITFHLKDSLPLGALRGALPHAGNEGSERARIQRALDQGWGNCLLADPRAAAIVEDALMFGDGWRYVLLAWVVMPNHVHAVIQTLHGWALERVMRDWKGYTALQINALLEQEGSLWRREYFDRYVRDARHLGDAIRYLHNNPVKAGLVQTPQQWRYSSAWRVEDISAPYHLPYVAQE